MLMYLTCWANYEYNKICFNFYLNEKNSCINVNFFVSCFILHLGNLKSRLIIPYLLFFFKLNWIIFCLTSWSISWFRFNEVVFVKILCNNPYFFAIITCSKYCNCAPPLTPKTESGEPFGQKDWILVAHTNGPKLRWLKVCDVTFFFNTNLIEKKKHSTARNFAFAKQRLKFRHPSTDRREMRIDPCRGFSQDLFRYIVVIAITTP